MSAESYLIDGARSPIGLKNGQMVGVRSDDLTAMVIKGLMGRNTNIPSEAIEDVIVGAGIAIFNSWYFTSKYNKDYSFNLYYNPINKMVGINVVKFNF